MKLPSTDRAIEVLLALLAMALFPSMVFEPTKPIEAFVIVFAVQSLERERFAIAFNPIGESP
jgi:hypothetical protein